MCHLLFGKDTNTSLKAKLTRKIIIQECLFYINKFSTVYYRNQIQPQIYTLQKEIFLKIQ